MATRGCGHLEELLQDPSSAVEREKRRFVALCYNNLFTVLLKSFIRKGLPALVHPIFRGAWAQSLRAYVRTHNSSVERLAVVPFGRAIFAKVITNRFKVERENRFVHQDDFNSRGRESLVCLCYDAFHLFCRLADNVDVAKSFHALEDMP